MVEAALDILEVKTDNHVGWIRKQREAELKAG